MGFSPNTQLFKLSKNKQKRKNFNEDALENWTETVPFPFHTIYIDHKGPKSPPSNGKNNA